MQLENSTATSAFYQHVLAKTAIMGHSMGGGSTVLAASGQTNIQTIVCLAPAETNPSAITAASGVNVPAIVFSGNGDAVTPPANHHTPIYNALSSSCKSFLSILGGGHCYFANSNFNCDFGETTSGSTINLTRAQQQDITQDISSLWLSFHLKSDCSSWQSYLDSLGNSTRFTEIHQCGIQSLTLTATVSDASGGNNNGSIDLSVNGGSNSYNYQWSNGEYTQDISNLSPGTYIVVVTDANGCSKTDTFLVNSTSSIHAANFEMYLSVFPNPSNNELKIKSSIWCKSFRLIDMQGKIVMEREIQRNLNEMISVQILPRGIYYLDIEWGDSSKSRKKIILQ
jgi:dienelactone hydrolase